MPKHPKTTITGQKSILDMVVKKPRLSASQSSNSVTTCSGITQSSSSSADGLEPSASLSSSSDVNIGAAPLPPLSETVSDNSRQSTGKESCFDSADIYSYLSIENMSAATVHKALTSAENPTTAFSFPKSGSRNLRFQHAWLSRFRWLLYSKVQDGAYCKYCCLFMRYGNVGKGGHEKAGRLVKTPFNNWKDAIECFCEHEKSQYHANCQEKATNFQTCQNRNTDVALQLQKFDDTKRAENRSKLISIIKTVIFCARQGIGLRGDCDSGKFSLNDDGKKEGNFRSLLRFRIDAGDTALQNHLLTAASNATYTSPQTQNEIIDACGSIVLEQLVCEINKSGCFSAMADETMDVSGIEQFSNAVRYVAEVSEPTGSKFYVREAFLGFVDVHDTRGEALASTLLEFLEKAGVKIEFMRGQGYDGAAAMSGRIKGCAAVVQKKCPYAKYFHCASHSLNLALCHACSIPAIRNAMGVMKEVINFFRNSSKRSDKLQEVMNSCSQKYSQTRRARLLKLCETRWVEHLDAVIRFKDMLQAIYETLVLLQQDSDTETSSKAFSYCAAMEKASFIISLQCMTRIFGLCHGLSTTMQSSGMDIFEALQLAEDLRKEFVDMREKADTSFKSDFEEAEQLAKEIGTEMTVPRVTARQTHRDTYQVESAEDYYRVAVFIPFLDDLVQQLDSRFLKQRDAIQAIATLMPARMMKLDHDELRDLADTLTGLYPEDVSASPEVFQGELTMWRRACARITCNTFIDCLNECPKAGLHSVHNLLKIGACMPVTVATNERSFSTLRFIKPYTRNSMCNPRLSNLTLVYIHRDIEIDPEAVVNKFNADSRRRLKF